LIVIFRRISPALLHGLLHFLHSFWSFFCTFQADNPSCCPRSSTHFCKALERADSVALDPHKWLATPIECSCAIVGQGNLLSETFSLLPPYLQTEPDKDFGAMPWFAEYGFQQTRRFNALKLLWVIQQAGRTGLVAHIQRHNALAQYLALLVDDIPHLELMAPVELSFVKNVDMYNLKNDV
jgi:glutamate/tyrosine decarboxylase-like PLP-dependent enzyme